MNIEKLNKQDWKGTYHPISYTSEYYYDISIDKMTDGFNIPIQKKRFDKPFTHDPKDGEYPDKLYEDWWEKAEAFGIVEDGKLLAAIEVNPEEWSNRLLITELFVDKRIRGKGYGKKLINLAKKMTVEKGYRVLMLETQSSNVNAIDFYLSQGFTLIGFDSCCYSNTDMQRKEVRFNMGWFPNKMTE